MAKEKAQVLLEKWLGERIAPAGMQWLREKAARIAGDASGRSFFSAFSAAFRHSGKAPLSLMPDELREAEALAPGWKPVNWSCDEAARTYLMLALPHDDPEGHARVLDQALETADLGETLALLKALPLVPHPKSHYGRACLGVRSNMKDVFEAVALFNPYPADHFDEAAWNQLVLKALFVDAPLQHIRGIDRRANPSLARMLVDFAHERWAAGRPVSPELWRSVGPHADREALNDLKKVLETGSMPERRAAALALHACPLPEASRILDGRPELASAVREGRLTWEDLEQ